MDAATFSIGPTATYRDRRALWLAGVGPGSGVLVISVFPESGLPPPPETYWVEILDGFVMVWKANGGSRQRAYKVTASRCSCDGMRKMGAPNCKHADAISEVFRRGYLPAPTTEQREV